MLLIKFDKIINFNFNNLMFFFGLFIFFKGGRKLFGILLC
jgi:hypothetical protein